MANRDVDVLVRYYNFDVRTGKSVGADNSVRLIGMVLPIG